MSVRVERPSRTVGEQIGAVVRGSINAYISLFVGVIVLGILAGMFGTLGVVIGLAGAGYLLYRKGRGAVKLVTEKLAQREPEQRSSPAEAPAIEPVSEDSVLVGEILSQDHEPRTPLWLDTPMRNRHCYVIGKTRTGKTTLLESLAIQDMANGQGLAFIDPHGDAASALLGFVPEERTADVIYFDPTDERAPAFNPFALPYPPPKLAEDIVSVFRMLVGDSWGPRMEHLLRYGALTLLVDKTPRTLRDLRRLFLDDAFRRDIVEGLENEQLREFWEIEFPSIPEAAANPILNKLSAFLAPMSHLERIFSTPANDLDFSEILDSGKILLVNLSKGALGDEPARLLGGLLVTGLQQAALARASRPPAERRDFFLYVDEFQNFTVASFESILAESAKYRLNLTLANQNLGQLGSSLERAIFGNCSTLVSFQVSASDATSLRKEMHRSRLVVRPREETGFRSLSDFVEHQKQLYREALKDKYLGMSLEERREFRSAQSYHQAGSMLAAASQGFKVGEMMRTRRAEMERVLALLEQGTFEVKALSELFPDYEFRELSFPDIDDFLNLGQGVAFCRVGSADNVCAIECRMLPEVDPTSRDTVLAELAKRFERPSGPTPPPAPRRQREPEPASFRE